jgi:release factor glutamine methyltransferase
MAEGLTIARAIRLGSRYLRCKALRSPRQDAELLLASALGLDRTSLFAHPGLLLNNQQEARFRRWLRRRGAHYPIQYLRGTQEFYGHTFFVEPGVLIPRPETELLVEVALRFLRQMPFACPCVLEVGTGSGCVGISLALADSRVRVTATDLSESALRVARANAKRLRCNDRIQFLQADVVPPRSEKYASSRFHLVVSNPPYIDPAHSAAVDLSVRLFEPQDAVFAGQQGLAVYAAIFKRIPSLLSRKGYLVLELGAGTAREVVRLSQAHEWSLVRIFKDLAGIDRCAVFNRPPPTGSSSRN